VTPAALPRTSDGVPLGIRRLGLWPFIGFYGALLAVLVACFATTSYARKERVTGELVPTGGLLGVTARRDGFVSRVYINNGQEVRAGAPLIAISVDTQLRDGRQVGNLLSAAADEKALAIAQQQNAGLAEVRNSLDDIALRRTALDQQIRLIETSRAVAVDRVTMAQERIDKSAPLARKGYISGFQFQQYQDAVTTAKLALAELDQRRLDAIKQRGQLRVEEQQLQAKLLTDKSTATSARADLLTARASAMGQQELMLAAETGGRVTALRARTGAPVKMGETLAVVLPTGSKLQAQVWIPSRAIGFIRPGDEVTLMFDAFPYQTFGTAKGRVREVSAAPTDPQDLPAGTAQEPRYQVLVELEAQSVQAYGRRWSLVPGTKVEAVVILEKRTVLQWLLDPFVAFAGGSGR
jgi:membrane fusion protein